MGVGLRGERTGYEHVERSSLDTASSNGFELGKQCCIMSEGRGAREAFVVAGRFGIMGRRRVWLSSEQA